VPKAQVQKGSGDSRSTGDNGRKVSFVGFRPSEVDQQQLDAILMAGTGMSAKGAHLMDSWQERALFTLKEFPGYFGNTLLLCMVPSLFGFAATSVGMWHARLLCSEFSDVTATYRQIHDLAEVRSTSSIVAGCLTRSLSRTSFLVGITMLLCSKISPDVVLASSRLHVPALWYLICRLGVVQRDRNELRGILHHPLDKGSVLLLSSRWVSFVQIGCPDWSEERK
jgi:hypothetical protein